MIRTALTVLALAVGAAAAKRTAAPQQADVLILGGKVVDGSGGPARAADIAISGERITLVGSAASRQVQARDTIQAAGLVVAPGFIDPHAHSVEDLSALPRNANLNYLMQGVTTVLTGNDGGGPADVGSTLDRWSRQGMGTNAGLYVGHGSVRRAVLGASDAAPSPAQLTRMRELVRASMQAGALGLSTGLYYAPGSYAATEEVIELATVAAQFGGVYDTHMRDESSYTIGLLGSIRETIRIAREAGIAANISHIKALGADVWGLSDSAIRLIRDARAEGLRVTADQYPYRASGTSLSAALLPRWAEAGGRDSLSARANDASVRPRLLDEMRDNLRRRGGAASLLVTSRQDTSTAGRTLEEIAQLRGQDPVTAALEIILRGSPSVASFNMNESDIRAFMVQDFVMTGSDGSDGHPRKFGTYPLKYRQYVVDEGLITLEFFVRQSSALPAQTFGLRDRGEIREGYIADLVVFSETGFRANSTFDEPRLLASGVRFLFVNGRMAIADGEYTGALAGQVLRGPGAPGR